MRFVRMFARFIELRMATVVNRKVMQCLLLFFSVWSGINTACADEAFNDGVMDLPKNNRWMSWLSNDVRIKNISIPGTHDSGSRFGITGYSRNQSLTIPQQLNAGVRYLDIRLRHINNSFAIHHGEVFQQMMFSQVLKDTAAFLKANPSEFVFVRVKEEYTPENVTRSFEQTFEYYRKLYEGVIWKPVHFNPALSDVRGRIVFIQDFDSYLPPVGLHLQGFGVQDDWDYASFDFQRKAELIKRTINGALVLKSNVINNLAVSAPPYVPKVTASAFNKITFDYLIKNVLSRPVGDRYVGILSMDYPGSGLIDAIIRTNNVSCATVVLDSQTRQLATCFGKALTSLTDPKAYAVKCDGAARQTKDGVICYVTNTNAFKPVNLELQPTCRALASYDGRYLSCNNSFAATYTAPTIACNGLFNTASGLCTDVTSKQPKPLELSCYGTTLNFAAGSLSNYGCLKPVVNSPAPRSGGSYGSLIRPGFSIGR